MSCLSLRLYTGVLLAAVNALPQEKPGPPPDAAGVRFAVASIRPADPTSPEGSFWRTTPAGDIRVHAVPLLALIMTAYGVQEFQVVGYPTWVGSDRFDVEAKSGEPPPAKPLLPQSNPTLSASLRSLLADRCNLVVQRTTKTQDALVLKVAPHGTKMRVVEPDPGKYIRRPFSLHAEGMTMPELARNLSIIVRAPVTDQTGLTGAYGIDFRYSESPEMMAGRTMAPQPSDLPDVFRALIEQLGLVLVKQKAPIEVLVVKEIQRPSAN
ncbi:MAG: peptidase BlaR1 [Bryobacterales bacterium]|jgi:uncharacterized protein (TIGR03435 family)|nr:peptidase BlaR1 [Bryobacterales bacterium]